MVLVGGVTATWASRVGDAVPRWLLVVAGTGFGAIAIILWEVVEYLVMRADVGGLSLTYADTLSDLVLSTAGGAVGAVGALRRLEPGPSPPSRPAPSTAQVR